MFEDKGETAGFSKEDLLGECRPCHLNSFFVLQTMVHSSCLFSRRGGEDYGNKEFSRAVCVCESLPSNFQGRQNTKMGRKL
ncbi:hypothetical protein NPIL_665231 [Nephila pilipes]|uniref:Uncharacterized protein n=1 Tax=Nephila pilipes TaxID=299642 RepID=A0A8X6IJ71_NEPPI|nr:hypothetical protein NPIL_665231 [Nephila pilipes]